MSLDINNSVTKNLGESGKKEEKECSEHSVIITWNRQMKLTGVLGVFFCLIGLLSPLGLTRFLYTGREAPNTAVDPSTLPSIS